MIAGIVLVAIIMGFATLPLLKIRRQRDIRRTEAILEALYGECQTYRTRHGRYPGALPALSRDAWGRPIQYEARERLSLWSLGPDPADPSDDIYASDRKTP